MLMKRVLPGLIMALLWVLLLFFAPPFVFWLVIVIGGGIALYEFFKMVDAAPGSGTRALAIGAGLVPLLCAFNGSPAAVLTGAYLGLLMIVLLVLSRYTRFADVFKFVTSAGFAIFYLSLCSAHLILLRFWPDGGVWLFLLTVITAGSDTGAYYAGRAFGRAKLCPSISPGKTVNGAIGGIATAALLAVVAARFLLPAVSSATIAVVAILLAAVGICGDLSESIIKRATGVKDSGTLLGGHGGLLDRIDSLLLTAPLLFALLYFGVL
jgi:phosphatidate cytidylyltransferase